MAYIAQSMFSLVTVQKRIYRNVSPASAKKKEKLSVQRERVKKKLSGKFKALLQRLSIVTRSVKKRSGGAINRTIRKKALLVS